MDRKLKTTLLELLENKDFENITVKMICENAQVNRSTFYAHYTDIYEIMDQMEEHLHQKLLQSYTPDDLKDDSVLPGWPFLPFLRHVKENRHFYAIVLKQRKNFPLKQGYESMWNRVIKPKCEMAGITSEAEMMYYYVYFQAGLTMALRRWVDTGCQEPEEEMVRMIRNCIPVIWSLPAG